MHTGTATTATDLRHHLDELAEERSAARRLGLGTNRRYLADLEREIAVTRAAFTAAAVTEIASLRAALDGPLVG